MKVELSALHVANVFVGESGVFVMRIYLGKMFRLASHYTFPASVKIIKTHSRVGQNDDCSTFLLAIHESISNLAGRPVDSKDETAAIEWGSINRSIQSFLHDNSKDGARSDLNLSSVLDHDHLTAFVCAFMNGAHMGIFWRALFRESGCTCKEKQ